MTDTTDDADDEIEIEIERAERIADDLEDNDALEDLEDLESADQSADRNPPNEPSSPLDRYDRPDPAESSPEHRLEDELGRIDVSTTSDGYVEGRVTGLESVDETTVRLAVSLPHGERVSFTLEKPIPWSEEFLLARIVEDVGYDAASISHLLGERVYLTRVDLESEAAADGSDWDWLHDPAKSAGDALLASFGSRFRLAEQRQHEWRLVDPRERRTAEDADQWIDDPTTLGLALIVLGPLITAVGVAYGLTGGLAISGAVIGAALLGLLVAFLGASALLAPET